jgi:hypothetical protein
MSQDGQFEYHAVMVLELTFGMVMSESTISSGFVVKFIRRTWQIPRPVELYFFTYEAILHNDTISLEIVLPFLSIAIVFSEIHRADLNLDGRGNAEARRW